MQGFLIHHERLVSGHFVNFDFGKNAMVLSPGSAGERIWLALPLKPEAQAKLTMVFMLGPVTLSAGAGKAVFATDTANWTVDILNFSGTPKLKVRSQGGVITVSLRQARFPGTNIPADFTAQCFKDDDQERWLIDLSFAWGGFAARVDLENWLNGIDQAQSTLLGVEEICPLGPDSRLLVRGKPVTSFYPSWCFVLAGDVRLGGFGEDIERRVLALCLMSSEMPGLLKGFNPRRTFFTLGYPALAPSFAVPVQGNGPFPWKLSGQAACFSSATIETSENQLGAMHRLVSFISLYVPAAGGHEPRLDILPGADLIGDSGESFALGVRRPVLCMLFDQARQMLGRGVLGWLDRQPKWLHTPRVSVRLGSPQNPCILLAEVGGRTLFGHPARMAKDEFGLQFRLLASAARPGGDLIANPVPFPGQTFATLSLGLPDPGVKPVQTLIRVDGAAEARIIFPPTWWSLQFRHTDLLLLLFRFDNLRLDSQGKEAKLVRENSAPARITVYFPPQSLAEQTTEETATTFPLPVPCRLSGLSQLSFTVGAFTLPFSPEQLLAWIIATELPSAVTAMHPSLATWAHSPSTTGNGYRPREWETAIEAPVRMLLSPDQHGAWEGRLSPAVTENRAELWHVRLKDGGGSTPVVRAYACDEEDNANTPLLNDITSLTKQNRIIIAEQSRGQHPVQTERLMLSALGAWLDLRGEWDAGLESWRHIATLGRDHYVRVVKRFFLLPFCHRVVFVEISERKFHMRTGGFQEARLVKRRFILIREPERVFHPKLTAATDGNPLPWGHSAMDFPKKYLSGFPFRVTRLTTRISPLIEDPSNPQSSIMADDEDNSPQATPQAFWPKVKDASGNLEDVLFHVQAEDWAGETIEFDMPMAMIRACRNGPDDVEPKELPNAYFDIINSILPTAYPGALAEVSSNPALKRHLLPFASQIITFAPPQANSRNTAAEVITMALYPKCADIAADRDANRPCLPAMAEAAIVLPMIRQFGGQKNPGTGAIEPTRAVYADAYRQHGFGEGNAGQLCLRLPDGVALNFGADNRPDQAGGLACPSMLVGALSRSQGAAGATSKGSTFEDTDLAALAANTFDPASYFNSSTATLLGAIKLPEILQNATVIPQWSTVGEGAAIIHQLVWDTAVPTSTDIFISKTTTRLLLKIAVKIQADGAAASTIQGTLTDFGIFLGGIIGLNFKSLQFFMPTGGKPVVHVELAGQGVAFDGPLTFLQALQDHLGLENFTDPPSLEVSAEGITAGYSLSIPTIAVGAFALQNLALSAGLNLPFTGAPIRARFALSERHNPFLVTVSLFTGGGFFGVIVGPDGVHLLEACLEFGGCFSLNLGVASGGVYVMAGIYIQIADKVSQLSGYVRAGGALEVLGLITVSVEFYLELSYLEPKTARGQASLTVKVEVLFFSKSVTLTVERTFTSGSRDIGFSEMMNKEQWHTYLGAFAEEGQ